jgi:hypothetical protein
VTGEARAAQVAEVPDGGQDEVQPVVGQGRPLHRISDEHIVVGVVTEAGEQLAGGRGHRAGDGRVEMGARAGRDHVEGGIGVVGAKKHLARLGHVSDTSSQTQLLAGQALGHTLAVPARVGLLDAGPYGRLQPDAIG